MQEANLASKKFKLLLESYKVSRGLSDVEGDMIRDDYKGTTFALANVELPRDTFQKAVTAI